MSHSQSEPLASKELRGGINNAVRVLHEARSGWLDEIAATLTACAGEIERLQRELQLARQHVDFLEGVLNAAHQRSNLREAVSAREPRPVHPNLLREESSDWETTKNAGEVTCHSRMIDGVLCRWWGDGPAPAGVASIDRAAQPPADDLRDAERYRWLRIQHWNESAVAVVTDPKENVRLGVYCPSGELLDDFIDAARAAVTKAAAQPPADECEDMHGS